MVGRRASREIPWVTFLPLALLLLLPPGTTPGVSGEATPHQCSCGIRRAANGTIYERIQIEPGEWPWHTLIYFWNGSRLEPPSQVCEGALIDEGYVLAASHCLLHGEDEELLPMEGLVVHVGAVSLQQDTEGSRRFKVENITLDSASDLALIELKRGKADDDWAPVPVCVMQNLDLAGQYGSELYILHQNQRKRIGGYEPVKLVLDEFLHCSGSTLAVKARAINGTTVAFNTKDLNIPTNDRGSALYYKHPAGWSLAGFAISNRGHQWTPGTVCLPNDVLTFESFDPALDWITENISSPGSAEDDLSTSA